ncbi:MAG: flagellar biosynthesis protein FlhB [Helicobacteraceae bacterium]|jgi:flagellar biosynthetic protein FlhB|nr:flagellar biosynthesis protein FlhB [Helicobacteraceae bacterium]
MAEEASGEKTEEATPEKIRKAREEGNVPKSVDTAGFVALSAALLSFAAFFSLIAGGIMAFFRYSFSHFGAEMGQNSLVEMALTTAWTALKYTLPIATIVAVFGALGYIMQFGLLFSPKPLTPDINKINPIKGFGNLFSMQKVVEGLKITAKVAVAVAVGAKFLWGYIAELPRVQILPLPRQIAWLVEKALILALIMLLVFFFFAIADLAITRYFHFKRLRMSKQEIRDEFKNLEGSPEIKARIRRVQMQMSRKRMMQDVPKASVVVTNPTHFAVALRYEPSEGDKAPVVVAKGADMIALKIKEIAREHDIPIVENASLARELYKLAELGSRIPDSLFAAVAEVFAYVYRIKNKTL